MAQVLINKRGEVKNPKANRIRRFGISDLIILILLSIFGISILYPFYNAILVSIVPNTVYLPRPDAHSARHRVGRLRVHL